MVCWVRRREILLNEQGMVENSGVSPESIPDFLALVGDSADGCPGYPGWGEKLSSTVLAQDAHVEEISDDPARLGWSVRREGPCLKICRRILKTRNCSVSYLRYGRMAT